MAPLKRLPRARNIILTKNIMSSLPLISHRLFVAAVSNETVASCKQGSTSTGFNTAQGKAASMPLVAANQSAVALSSAHSLPILAKKNTN